MTETKQPPVKPGDVIRDQEVINAGKRNDGVVKYEGFIIFVSDCKIGDIVSFRVSKVLPNFGVAEKLKEDE